MPPPPKSAIVKALVITALCIPACVLALCVIAPMELAIPFAFFGNRAATEQERFLLYQVDHQALGVVLRDYATQQRWGLAHPPPEETDFRKSTPPPPLPPRLQLLKPSYVRVDDEQIDLEFGGPFMRFGVSAFRPGLPGAGTKQLGEGLWFYAENQRVPSKSW